MQENLAVKYDQQQTKIQYALNGHVLHYVHTLEWFPGNCQFKGEVRTASVRGETSL